MRHAASPHYAQRAPMLGIDRVAEIAPRTLASPLKLNPDAETGGDPAYAYANQGRWVVECPVSGCGGAQFASVTDQRFLCLACGNVENRGRYRPVAWPKQWREIGLLLDARPDEATRNWSPPETLKSLRLENAERGLR